MTHPRPGYRAAVAWIAANDEDAEQDPEEVAQQMTVCLVADLWDKSTMIVARDVLRYRRRIG